MRRPLLLLLLSIGSVAPASAHVCASCAPPVLADTAVSVKAQWTAGASAPAQVSRSIRIAGPLAAVCPASAAQLGAAYSSVIAATGGVAPYAFAIGSGALPADRLLAGYSDNLPYGVAASSAAGAQMTATAEQLDFVNGDGAAQPGCVLKNQRRKRFFKMNSTFAGRSARRRM